MVLFNYAKKEVTIKVVYYGPGLCGKTTNLKFIYDTLPSNSKSKMISLATNQDRTLFFDFLPLDLGTIRGMQVRLQLYTVPGQVYYNSTRRLVLKGADGVVFVADSQDFAYDANVESYKNLRENLTAHGIDMDTLPIVIQYNKRDLPNILPVEMLKKVVNPKELPEYEVIATTGFNVLETLKTTTQTVLEKVIKEHGLAPGDTLSLEEIDFGMKARKQKRRTTMMDFDETPDSVWEDEMPDEEEGGSNEEFLFEEVTEPKTAPPAQPAPPTEPASPTPPAAAPATNDEAPIVFEEEKPVVDVHSEEPSLFDEEKPPAIPSPTIQPPDDIVYEDTGGIPTQEAAPAPVLKSEAQATAPSVESSPGIIREPAGMTAPPTAPPMESEPEPPRDQPEIPAETGPAAVREIPLTIALTLEDIQRGEVTVTLHIKLKRERDI